MANLVMFGILAVIILGSAIVCVFTNKVMRAATFLLFVLLGVSGIYFLLDYTFLGAAQVSIYVGGITMVYIFAIQLVSKRTLQGLIPRFKGSKAMVAALLSVVGFLLMVMIFTKNELINKAASVADQEVSMDIIGKSLMGADKYQYVLPFEFISLFLLACIIGGIVIAREEVKK